MGNTIKALLCASATVGCFHLSDVCDEEFRKARVQEQTPSIQGHPLPSGNNHGQYPILRVLYEIMGFGTLTLTAHYTKRSLTPE